MKCNYTEYYLQIGTIQLLNCTQIGKQHLINNIPNQDRVGYQYNKNAIAVAIADGVGSCIHSGDGAECAIDSMKSIITLNGLIDKEIVRAILSYWQTHISYSAEESGCTLAFALVNASGILVGSIGDSSTYIFDGESVHIIKNSGEFVNYTDALPMTNFEIHHYELKPVTIVMITDGVANEIIESSILELCKFLDEGMKLNPELLGEDIEKWLIGLQDSNGDDKTISVMTLQI